MKAKLFVLVFLILTTTLSFSQTFEKQGAGATILVHGWDPDGNQPAWMTEMANAIAERNGGVGHIATINVTGTQGDLTATCADWDFNLASQNHAEIVVLLNWTAVANHLETGITAQEVAAAAAPKIYNPQHGQPALAELPIHLIGHSRGGGMVFEMARLLGLQGVEVDQLTALDPHPLTNADPQGVDPPMGPGQTIDTPIAVYENILFVDNYYQAIEAPMGEYVDGAYNRLWTSLPGGYHNESGYTHTIGGTTFNFSDHLNIILAYHGTIDLATPASNGEATMEATERGWFNAFENTGENTGFKYSRQIMGNRKSTDTPVDGGDSMVDGYHEDIGGNGQRQPLDWTLADWPNAIEILVAHDDVTLETGSNILENNQELEIAVAYRGYDNAGSITLFVDADRNPYNDNNIATISSESVSATGSSIAVLVNDWEVGDVPEEDKFYIYAEYDDGTKMNYLYTPHEFEISITASAPGGSGTEGDPYQIATLNNLLWITQDVSRWDKHYIQTDHIDASTTSTWNDGEGWIPIGTFDDPFTGSYNGQEYTIDGLYINSQTSTAFGFFGITNATTFRNIGLTNIEIASDHNSIIGCLAAVLDEGTIVTNCYATGSITSTNSGSVIGGLVGASGINDTVENSSFNGNITGVDGRVGGLIGYNKGLVTGSFFSGTVSCSGDDEDSRTGGLVGKNEEGTITRCYSAGNVTGIVYVGGLVGLNSGSSERYGVIEYSHSSAIVDAESNYVGGLIGYNLSNHTLIRNCYSLGAVSGSVGVGGLVGVFDGGTVEYCYSTGLVSGTESIGGLIGAGEPNSTVHSFWDTQTSGQETSDGGTGKTTAEMKNIYTFTGRRWDFKGLGYDGIWNIGNDRNDGYPYLTWEYPADPGPTDIIPTVFLESVSEIIEGSVDVNMTITNKGNPNTTEHGACWSTSPNPTIDDNRTTEGDVTEAGSYETSVSGLESGNIYYLRAYVRNSIGVHYSNQNMTVYPPDGEGTEENPYQIATLASLLWISDNTSEWDKHYIQTANIGASETATWNDGEGWSPIGNDLNRFTGTYNGKGFSISELYINRPGTDYQGLFGDTQNAALDSITLEEASIHGKSFVGPLSGRCSNGTVSFCRATGTVQAAYNNVGGLLGWNSGTVTQCLSESSVSGAANVGGLIGYSNGIINNGFATGNVEGTNQYVGGLLGSNWDTVNACFSAGNVSGSATNIGGLIGKNSNTVNNSFWDTETSGHETSDGGTGKTTAEMKNIYTFTGRRWDFKGLGYDEIWNIGNDRNDGYPYLAWEYPADPGPVDVIPAVFLESVSDEVDGNATIDFTITNIGNPNTTEHGVCWSTSPNPTVDDTKTQEGSVTQAGDASSQVSGIEQGTAFYVRAYAENSVGVHYSQEAIVASSPLGSGTSGDPYQINSLYDLLWISNSSDRWDKHYIQTANIDASETATWNDGEGWSPIGNDLNKFTGTYNGKGFSISELYINRPGIDYQGLFGYTENAALDSITLEEASIHGKSYVGPLSGRCSSGTISFCRATGTVQAADGNAGGLLGWNSGTVTRCLSESNVSGAAYVGGLVGYSTGIVNNSFATGNVEGTNQYVGGLLGRNQGAVTACFSAGNVSGSASDIGGLIGNNTSTVSDSFWDTQTSGQETSAGGTGKTTLEMKNKTTFHDASWDFTNIWKIYDGHSYPFLIWYEPKPQGDGSTDTPYIISNLTELAWLSENSSEWGKHFIQTADIDASETAAWNDGEGWSPIGNNIDLFSGSYNGQGFAISGLYIDRSISENGLFGTIFNAELTDIGVVDLDYYITIGNYTGGLVGYSYSSSVSGCYSTGDIVASDYTGGLVGNNRESSISNSYSTAAVEGNNGVGGLAGFNENGTISFCYSVGIVDGSNNTGGLVGENSGDVLSSFWDTQTSGQETSDGGTGEITSRMQQQTTYTDWDFMGETTNGENDYWGINQNENNGYPFLKWQGYKLFTEVTENPTAESLQCPTPLENVNLTGGTANTEGSFAFANPEDIPPEGTSQHEVLFTPADEENYSTVSVTIDVTVEDDIQPEITSTHEAQTIDADENCEASLPDYTGDVTASDNCTVVDDLTITQTPAAGTTISGQTNPLTLRVEDEAGNFTEVSFNVAVEDNTGPEITSTHNDRQLEADANCEASLPDYTGDVTASDNCTVVDDLTITQTPAAGTTISGQTNPLTLRVEDEAGNFTEVSFNVAVEDNTGPEITSTHNDRQLEADANCEASLPDYTGDLTASDNCTAVDDLTITQTPAAGTTISGQTNPLTLRVEDEAGNFTEVSFNVAVEDNTGPEITSTHNDRQTDADANCEASLPDYTGDLTASDNCTAVDDLTITQTPAAGTTISGQTNPLTLTVTDEAGNFSEVSFNAEVVDITNPTITCVENQVIDLNEGESFYTVQGTEFDPIGADDNCELASVLNDFNDAETLSGAEFPGGTTTVVWTATDAAGNTQTCSFDVTVNAAVGISNLSQNGITIYPNPTNGILTVNFSKFSNFGKVGIAITDITGKTIKNFQINSFSNFQIDISHVQNGIYFLKIETENGVYTQKIIKQ